MQKDAKLTSIRTFLATLAVSLIMIHPVLQSSISQALSHLASEIVGASTKGSEWSKHRVANVSGDESQTETRSFLKSVLATEDSLKNGIDTLLPLLRQVFRQEGVPTRIGTPDFTAHLLHAVYQLRHTELDPVWLPNAKPLAKQYQLSINESLLEDSEAMEDLDGLMPIADEESLAETLQNSLLSLVASAHDAQEVLDSGDANATSVLAVGKPFFRALLATQAGCRVIRRQTSS